MTSFIQASFTGGELSPHLYGRVDLTRYFVSARTMRNFIAQIYGGATNRAGFRFIYEAKYGDRPTRLIDFQFSTLQNYAIEIGDHYMRFYMNGGIIETAPGSGVPYEIETPYAAEDVFELKYTQSQDVLTLCHPEYRTRDLTRSGHANWTLTEYQNKNGPFQDVNINQAVTVTASAVTGTGILLVGVGTNFLPEHVGTLMYLEDGHKDQIVPWVAGQRNKPAGALIVGSLRRSDGKVYKLSEIPASVGSGDSDGGYRTGGNRPVHDFGSAWDGDRSIEVTGKYADGVKWDYVNAGFGVVKITAVADATHATADVISELPASAVSTGTYLYAHEAWGGDQGYPVCVAYHQERKAFGGTLAQPQKFWLTQTGSYVDFATNIPVLDTDAINKIITGRRVNAIKHFLPTDDLIIMTSGAEFLFKESSQKDGVTPTSFAKLQTSNGISDLAPLLIVDAALYVQAKGSVIRDLAYTYEKDKYTGGDLTTLAAHLFRRRTLVDWCYAQDPHSVVWAVRDDGILLGMTYMKEQQVLGWHRHDTKGKFKSVCSVPQGAEDRLYAVVQRTINGEQKQYIEVQNSREFESIEDAFFVDSGLTYDGRNQAGTITLSGGTSWDSDDVITATLAGAGFNLTNANLFDAIVLPRVDADGGTFNYRLTIIEVDSATVCKVSTNRFIKPEDRVAQDLWHLAVLDVAGLGHLEGEQLSILVDGSVHDVRTVVDGAITLQEPAYIIHAGLGYVSDLETLDLANQSGETLRDKQKNIPKVSVIMHETRGIRIGTKPDAPATELEDEAINLYEIPEREFENYDDPTLMQSGLRKVSAVSTFEDRGRVFIRQDQPLPATILAVIPDATVTN